MSYIIDLTVLWKIITFGIYCNIFFSMISYMNYPGFGASGSNPAWKCGWLWFICYAIYDAARLLWGIHPSVNWVIIGSGNNLSPTSWHQTITWSNDDIFSIKLSGTNFREIFKQKYDDFHSRKCIWKCPLQYGSHIFSASICWPNIIWSEMSSHSVSELVCPFLYEGMWGTSIGHSSGVDEGRVGFGRAQWLLSWGAHLAASPGEDIIMIHNA